jgi:hypothetical protein
MRAAPDDVHVAERDRIERAGIDACPHMLPRLHQPPLAVRAELVEALSFRPLPQRRKAFDKLRPNGRGSLLAG